MPAKCPKRLLILNCHLVYLSEFSNHLSDIRKGWGIPMKLMKSSALALVLGLASTSAFAEGVADNYNTYVGIGGGVNIIPDNDADLTTGLGTTTGEAEFDNGWAALGTLGVYLDGAWRVEVEGGYRDNELDSFNGAPISGDVNGWSVMFNALKDIPTGSKVTPYVGAGLGVARRTFKVDGLLDDTDTGLAYQGIAGLSVDVGERTQLFADYRYFRTHDLEYSDDSSGVSLDDWDDENHTIMLGLRFAFNPKAAPIVEGPAAPENFVVYFDVDSSQITADAATVLDRVADAAKAGNVVRLDLEGHTSTTASNAYNLDLSEDRVNAVKDALIARGLDAATLATAFFGETALAVQTGDGVEEPLNRRATIVFGN